MRDMLFRSSRLTFLSLDGLLLGCLLAAQAAEPKALFVSPHGNDQNPGTRAKPFATLVRARDEARRLPADRPRLIRMRGGDYYNVSLALDSRDSGLRIEGYNQERPRLYGGQPVTGWQWETNLLVATLPPFPTLSAEARTPKGGSWQIRMLEVNGQWCSRSRLPAEGSFAHQTRFDVPWMSTTGGGWKRKPTQEELTTLQYEPGTLGNEMEIADAEVTVYHMWDESCVGVQAHDPLTRTLRLAPECGHPPGAFGVKKFVVWNLPAGLTRPGQFWHDHARNRLSYLPRAGERPEKLRCIVPTMTTVVRIAGGATNVALRNLDVGVTTVPLVSGGFAAEAFDGAISLQNTDSCVLENLRISHVAGHAIRAKGKVTNTRIAGCDILECGAGGIYVGGKRSCIEDNLVRGIGYAYPSAVGIYEGGEDCVVRHNDVSDCSYSGINYGGTRVTIERNRIHDCMKTLHDGAAIYMFGARDSVLRGNYAFDIVDRGGYGASAYYLDEQSTNCVVENNVTLRVGWPSHNHMATNNIIRNNIFVVDGDLKITFPRSTGYHFERNVLFATGKIRVENVSGVSQWSQNLFFSGAGKVEGVQMRDYSTTGSEERAPGDTVLADPLFWNWRDGDLRFKSNSPAKTLGIQPVDQHGAGVRRKNRGP